MLDTTPHRPTTNSQAATANGRKLIALASGALDEQILVEELGPGEQERAGDLEPDRDAVERHHSGRQQLARGAERQEVLEEHPGEDQAAEADQRVGRRRRSTRAPRAPSRARRACIAR